jgi:hypothetical protein
LRIEPIALAGAKGRVATSRNELFVNELGSLSRASARLVCRSQSVHLGSLRVELSELRSDPFNQENP